MERALMTQLSDVLDPETGSSVLSLGIVRRVVVERGRVRIDLDRTHPLARHFASECEAAARDAVPGAESIEVRLVEPEAA